MEDILKELFGALMPVVGTVASLLATWGLAEVGRFVRSKTKNEAVDAALGRVSHTTQTVVDELAQTLVRRAADGKIDAEDAKHLKAVAVRRIKEQLPGAVMAAASAGVNDLQRLIEGKVEQAVVRRKADAKK